MNVNSPMLKSIFSFNSKILLILGLAGCSKTLTNVTPDDAQRNPSNLYRFTTQCNIRMNKIIPETLKLSLWKEYEHNRDAYTNAKTEFVRKYTEKAKEERKTYSRTKSL